MWREVVFLLVAFRIGDARTVRYSNVAPSGAVTTKTYEISVPGSTPIRIIEAEPIWSKEDVPSTTPRPKEDLEHRSSKQKNSTEPPVQSERPTYSPEALNKFLKEYSDKIKADRKNFDADENDSSTKESSESGEIKDDKSKRWGLVDVQYHNHPFEDQKGWVTLEAVPWSTSKISKWQSHHTTSNKYESKPWNNHNQKPVGGNWHDNYHGNALNKPQHDLEDNKYNNKYPNNNQGTSLSVYFSDFDKPDTRPLSSSRPTYQDTSKPVYGYDQKPLQVKPEFSDWPLEIPSKPLWTSSASSHWNNKPGSTQWDTKPGSSQWDNKPVSLHWNSKPGSSNWDNKPGSSHWENKPGSSHWDNKPGSLHWDNKPGPSHWDNKPGSSHWENKPDSLYWNNKPGSSHWDNKPGSSQWNKKPGTGNLDAQSGQEPWYYDKKPLSHINSNNYGGNDNSDIITDGRPGNFPTPYSLFNSFEALKDRPGNTIHPATHPETGNGEWVLLSTTKGYQYPRNKNQRSIDVTPDSIGARKGIRLTVLPPSNDTKINMTTSHGGLLEVESTFESVEESQNKFSERVKLKNKPKPMNKVTRRPVKPNMVQVRPVSQKRPAAKPVSVVPNKQDPTAVLAAVGAGMVPATMAMLVPFVAGRRRRSVEDKFDVTNRREFRRNVIRNLKFE